jgi:hypothetical protein
LSKSGGGSNLFGSSLAVEKVTATDRLPPLTLYSYDFSLKAMINII